MLILITRLILMILGNVRPANTRATKAYVRQFVK